MGFSPLADMKRRIPDGGRSSRRNASVSGMGLHHNAGVNAFGEASRPGREVSANYWITNEGALLPNVDENRRAWTSGHPSYPAGAAADHRNITVEISNSPEGVRNGTWAISAAAAATLVALMADVHRRYNLGAVRRSASRGVGVHSDWVATECPGRYVRENLPAWIRQANDILQGKSAVEEPDDPEEEDGEMRVRVIVRQDSKGGFSEASRLHPDIGSDLAVGKSRKDGNVTVFEGYEVTTNERVATAWARTHERGFGRGTVAAWVGRTPYMDMQAQARRLKREIHR